MNFPIAIQPNPFRFLLYTEWVMLASCGFMAVMEAFERQSLPVLHILILLLLGLMGLRLPSGQLWLKVLYTAIEVSLIFFGTTLGYLHILPTLYLIVVIRSCFLFDLPGRLAIAALSFILYLMHQVQYLQNITQMMLPQMQMQRVWMHQIAEVLMFALGLFFVLQLVNLLLIERNTRQELALAHAQLQQYARQVEDFAAIQERNRIARDIHDSLGHALTALNVQLQTVARLWQVDSEQAKSFFAQAQRLGELAITEVRQSVSALRVDAQVSEPLEQTIESLVQDFRQGTGISVSVSIRLHFALLPQTVKTIYRIVQEALTNISKHATATQVQIQLDNTADNVCLAIADNGRGFRLDQNTLGFGLQSMQERAAAIGGCCNIESQPGAGCRITVKLPLIKSSSERLLALPTVSVKPKSQIDRILNGTNRTNLIVDREFIRRCERELSIFIGPVAAILVQKALKSRDRISATELVDILAAEIPSTEWADDFRQRTLF
jgi:signal transduction histidine kinase